MVTVLFLKTHAFEILISCLCSVAAVHEAEVLLSLVGAESASLETIISSFLGNTEHDSFEKGQYFLTHVFDSYRFNFHSAKEIFFFLPLTEVKQE